MVLGHLARDIKIDLSNSPIFQALIIMAVDLSKESEGGKSGLEDTYEVLLIRDFCSEFEGIGRFEDVL